MDKSLPSDSEGVSQSMAQSLQDQYNPALEWPGMDIDFKTGTTATNNSASTTRPCLRLVVQSSPVLPRKRRIAVLDAYDEVQVGRDASTSRTTPRIRLKDMEVSKLHVTIFWDNQRKEWAIVDMGSKHGTFVSSVLGEMSSASVDRPHQPETPTSSIPSSFRRLSAPKCASLPHSLRHLDQISVGRSTFTVHVHLSGIPCQECSSSEDDFSIPLFGTSLNKKTLDTDANTPAAVQTFQDARVVISNLKKTLLPRHSVHNEDTVPSQTYIDRSAIRRAMYPDSHLEPPGVPARILVPPVTALTRTQVRANPQSFPAEISSAPSPRVELAAAPISESNIGHRLLRKQGWAPGGTLGLMKSDGSAVQEAADEHARLALTEPLQITANVGKLGLGMRNTGLVSYLDERGRGSENLGK